MPPPRPMKGVLARVLKRIREYGGSVRALARQAKVPHSTLSRAAKGQINLSRDVAQRIVRVLRRWSAHYEKLADDIEKADKKRSK